MNFAKSILIALALIFMMTAAAPLASAQAEHVRWDIANVICTGANEGYPCTFNPGGIAVAMANDCAATAAGFGPLGCSTITLTGSGTFVVPATGGPSTAVTGGGTWTVNAGDGTVTKGTFAVTELVQWQKSEPLVLPAVCGTCESTDNIGIATQLWGGLAVVRVAYSDGTTGVLTMACSALQDPLAVTGGITASKPVILTNIDFATPPLPVNYPTSKVRLPILFWNPGVFQYTVEFHVN